MTTALQNFATEHSYTRLGSDFHSRMNQMNTQFIVNFTDFLNGQQPLLNATTAMDVSDRHLLFFNKTCSRFSLSRSFLKTQEFSLSLFFKLRRLLCSSPLPPNLDNISAFVENLFRPSDLFFPLIGKDVKADQLLNTKKKHLQKNQFVAISTRKDRFRYGYVLGFDDEKVCVKTSLHEGESIPYDHIQILKNKHQKKLSNQKKEKTLNQYVDENSFVHPHTDVLWPGKLVAQRNDEKFKTMVITKRTGLLGPSKFVSGYTLNDEGEKIMFYENIENLHLIGNSFEGKKRALFRKAFKDTKTYLVKQIESPPGSIFDQTLNFPVLLLSEEANLPHYDLNGCTFAFTKETHIQTLRNHFTQLDLNIEVRDIEEYKSHRKT